MSSSRTMLQNRLEGHIIKAAEDECIEAERLGGQAPRVPDYNATVKWILSIDNRGLISISAEIRWT